MGSADGHDWTGEPGVQRLTGLSFAHPVVPAGHRARLARHPGSIPGLLEGLRSEGHNAFFLSTCLRVEILWEGNPEQASSMLTSIYSDQAMPEGAIVRTNEEAFRHLCRVAAGLESPTLGEPEVLAQVRQAIAWFDEGTASSSLLGRALGATVGVARKVRRRLGTTEGGSLAMAAVSLAGSHQHVAIFGAGSMARATARSLAGNTATVYSRRQDHVDGAEPRPWEAFPEAFSASSVVISAIPGPAPNAPEDGIGAALASRETPLFLADLGMPPGFDWLRSHSMVTYVGIDEIASSVTRTATPELDAIVDRESAAAWARLSAPDVVGEVIAALVDSADRAVDEEVRRFAGRLQDAEDPEMVLRQLAHTVARRVIHPPISYVGTSSRSGEAADLLGRAYGVIDE